MGTWAQSKAKVRHFSFLQENAGKQYGGVFADTQLQDLLSPSHHQPLLPEAMEIISDLGETPHHIAKPLLPEEMHGYLGSIWGIRHLSFFQVNAIIYFTTLLFVFSFELYSDFLLSLLTDLQTVLQH